MECGRTVGKGSVEGSKMCKIGGMQCEIEDLHVYFDEDSLPTSIDTNSTHDCKCVIVYVMDG